MITKMHESWNPIKGPLYDDPLATMNTIILPEINYYPKKEDIFNVFQTPVNDIKVVILGQDPYPTPGNANGLAFAVSENTPIPVSLRIIAQEISNCMDIKSESLIDKMKPLQELNNRELYTEWRTLKHWQEQGIFLLNTALTVESGKAGSHLLYWEDFTKRVISYISLKQPCIWLLWGKKAQSFAPYIRGKVMYTSGYDKETIEFIPINSDFNYIMTAPHPAAEAYSGGKAGFFGCNHFYYVNSILKNKSLKEIKW